MQKSFLSWQSECFNCLDHVYSVQILQHGTSYVLTFMDLELFVNDSCQHIRHTLSHLYVYLDQQWKVFLVSTNSLVEESWTQ